MGSLLRYTKYYLQISRMFSTSCNNTTNINYDILNKTLVGKINNLLNNIIPLDKKDKLTQNPKKIIDKDDDNDDSNLKKMNDRYD